MPCLTENQPRYDFPRPAQTGTTQSSHSSGLLGQGHDSHWLGASREMALMLHFPSLTLSNDLQQNRQGILALPEKGEVWTTSVPERK
jgi:hypothetical protein